jgi:threonine dehydrogenase-like Zn-dependent dehydrogenase
MRQLVYVRRGKLEWREAPEPTLRAPTGALVRPMFAARCDLDHAFLRHDYRLAARIAGLLRIVDPMVLETFGNPPFQGPFPYGHECVGKVVRVGEDVKALVVGQMVVVPFQISCGQCTTCQRGFTAHCPTDRRTPVAAYGFGAPTGGWGGVVSDLVYVPHADHMLVPVPDGVDPATLASAGDNLPDGFRTVASHLAARPGAPVLILGGTAPSVSLYAVASAVALGASRVDYVDSSVERLALAERLGASLCA